MTPTPELRWREMYDGETGTSPTATSPYKHKVCVLQQKWIVTAVYRGTQIALDLSEFEWRDVPTMEETK